MSIKWKGLGIGALCVGFSLSPLAQAIASQFEPAVVADSESQHWSSYKVKLTSSDNQAVDLKHAKIRLVLPLNVAAGSINWSSNAVSHPELSVSHSPVADGILHEISLAFPEGSWVDTELLFNEHFTLTIGLGGQIADLAAFEKSVQVITDGSTLPEVSLDILSPVEGADVLAGDPVNIQVKLEGEGASRLEFWNANDRIAVQTIVEGTTDYQQSWTPSVLGNTQLKVMVFDGNANELDTQTVNLKVTSSAPAPNPPEITFISPEEGSSHKQNALVRVAAEVTDRDGDLSSVSLFANGDSICQLDATTSNDFACDWTPQTIGTVELKVEAKDAAQHTSTRSIQVTVTGAGSSCGLVPQYKDNVNYNVGDEVSNIGMIYSCSVFGWCGDPVWTPGTGHPDYPDAWKDAWEEVGQCDQNPTPDVAILSPQAGERVSPGKGFTVVTQASDDTAIAKVEVWLGNDLIATATTPNDDGHYLVSIPGQAEGQYTLKAIAFDEQDAHSESQSVSIAVTDKDVVVSLTSPKDGSSFYEGHGISITAAAESFEGQIASVDFYAGKDKLATDTQAPYQYDWTGSQVGEHELYAVATNDKNISQQSASSIIEVKKRAPAPDLGSNPDRAISYLTSWGLDDPAALNNAQVDGYFLSFGQWDASGNITTSEGIAEEPIYNAWNMSTPYITWTQLKHDKPETAMLVAFGGQTYEGIWSHMATDEQRRVLADNLATFINTPLPVYKKNLKPEEMVGECLALDWNGDCDYSVYQRAGYVQLDGLDFDFEKAARLTETENQNLTKLIDLIRDRVGDNKILSLTTYHVGADPVECQNASVIQDCSYIEESGRSSHHGEVIDLLKATKDKFDIFNVMAYDAGENFLYKVAMANYAKYVDKSKIVLGNTINQQWKPGEPRTFIETRENNIARTQWQKEQGYGGFFIWALGSNSANLNMEEQVIYFNEMDDVNK